MPSIINIEVRVILRVIFIWRFYLTDNNNDSKTNRPKELAHRITPPQKNGVSWNWMKASPQQNVEIQQQHQFESSSSFQQQSVTSSSTTTTQQVLNGSFEVSQPLTFVTQSHLEKKEQWRKKNRIVGEFLKIFWLCVFVTIIVLTY